MRISDWSSDVCSSDLADAGAAVAAVGIDLQPGLEIARIHRLACEPGIDGQRVADLGRIAQTPADGRGEHGRIDIAGRAAAHVDVAALGKYRRDRKSTRLNSRH